MIEMFEIDQVVSYGSNGIFKIEEIADINLTGSLKKYYVLKSANQNGSVVYVPVDNEKLISKIHPVLTADEVNNIIKDLPTADCYWIENDEERKKKFNSVISKSDPRELGWLIHSVYLHQQDIANQRKKLHIVDERAFREAERIFYGLISFVLNISIESVPSFIASKLQNQ